MLLRQDRGGAEQRGLLAVLDRLERRPHRNLRLAVAHVAADQAVQGVRQLHARLHLGDGLQLVGRLHERERILHLPLPCAVGREGVAGQHLARCVEGQELLGHLPGGAPGPVPRAAPLLAPQPGQGRRSLSRREVRADPVQEVAGDVEAVAPGVLQRQVLLLAVLRGHPPRSDEAGDAVVDVHDVGPGLQLRQERLAAECLAAQGASPLGASEHLAVGQQHQRARREGQRKPLEGGRGDEGDGARLRRRVNAGRHPRADVLLAQDFAQALRVVRQDDDALAVAGPAACAFGEGVEAAPEARRGRDARLPTVGRRAQRLQVELAGPGLERIVDAGPGPQRRGEVRRKLAPLLLAATLVRHTLLHLLARLPHPQRLVQDDDALLREIVHQPAHAEEAGVELLALQPLAAQQQVQLLPRASGCVALGGGLAA